MIMGLVHVAPLARYTLAKAAKTLLATIIASMHYAISIVYIQSEFFESPKRAKLLTSAALFTLSSSLTLKVMHENSVLP
jgi:hypothetical protein